MLNRNLKNNKQHQKYLVVTGEWVDSVLVGLVSLETSNELRQPVLLVVIETRRFRLGEARKRFLIALSNNKTNCSNRVLVDVVHSELLIGTAD